VLNTKESHTYIPQTWGFLRDSAAHVGDVAQEILNVQNNLEIMKADVEQGAMHWKKIQAALVQENSELRTKIAILLEKEQENNRFKAATARAEAELANLKAQQLIMMKDTDAVQKQQFGETDRVNLLIQQARDRTASYHNYTMYVGLTDQKELGKLLKVDDKREGEVHELETEIQEEKMHGGMADFKVNKEVQDLMAQIKELQVKFDHLKDVETHAGSAGSKFRKSEAGQRKEIKLLEKVKKEEEQHTAKCAAELRALDEEDSKWKNELSKARAKREQCIALGVQNAKLQKQLDAC